MSDCYLSYEDFGVPDVENVMSKVLSSEHAGDEAVSWTVMSMVECISTKKVVTKSRWSWSWSPDGVTVER